VSYSKILKQKLTAIDGQDYGSYQSLLGSYDFDLFNLVIGQIPKDPYAPPHTGIYRIQLQRSDQRIVNLAINSKIQKIACADFLARYFYACCKKICKGIRGTGFSGLITIDEPGQAILERNSVIILDEMIEVRCFVGLPADGRNIKSKIAEEMLFRELPEIINQSLKNENIDYDDLDKHIKVTEDAEYLRLKLDELGLIAFIANGALLARESGTSDKPLSAKDAVVFNAPDNMLKEIDLPHAGTIKGMGISRGITLITGGGYHGKSTLLATLEAGIYNHIPGDGREQCVSSSNSAKIRAYSGRYVVKTDISPFIKNLPYKKDTILFSTENASGSTSQAANIIEAIEAGASTLLMDEDTCATNFMIRDSKMQQLVNKDDEPITTFIDKVEQIYNEKNISSVIVLGGIGDYFDVSDQVIQMKNYQPNDVTKPAKQIADKSPAKRNREEDTYPFSISERIPLAESVSSLNQYGKLSLYVKEVHRINFGKYIIDLTDLEQLKELSQTKALAFALDYAKTYMDGKHTLREVAEQVLKDIEIEGIDVLSEKISGHFAWFRGLELAFTLNRLRSFDVT